MSSFTKSQVHYYTMKDLLPVEDEETITNTFSEHIAVLDIAEDSMGMIPPDLQRALRELGKRGCLNIILDLQKVDYLASSSLGIIGSAADQLQARGGILALCKLNNVLTRLMKVTKLETVLPIYPNRDQALTALSSR